MKYFLTTFLFLFLNQLSIAGNIDYNEPNCKMSYYLIINDKIEIDVNGKWKITYIDTPVGRTEKDLELWFSDAKQYSKCIHDWIIKSDNDRHNIQNLINLIAINDSDESYNKIKNIIKFDDGNLSKYSEYNCNIVNQPLLMGTTDYDIKLYNKLVLEYNDNLKQYDICNDNFFNNSINDYNLIKKYQIKVWNQYLNRIVEKKEFKILKD